MSFLIINSLLILFCAGSYRACDGLLKFGTFNWQRAREVHDWKWGNVQLTGNQLSVAVYEKERIDYVLKIFALVWERQQCSVYWMPYISEPDRIIIGAFYQTKGERYSNNAYMFACEQLAIVILVWMLRPSLPLWTEPRLLLSLWLNV